MSPLISVWIKNLHFQQAAGKSAIATLENVKVQSAWAKPRPWFILIVLGWVVAQAIA